ncbi:MAG: aminotransferase class I/II-fold pyridoxal phosphate-dependent enzyme [Pseudomonadota bacterium]
MNTDSFYPCKSVKSVSYGFHMNIPFAIPETCQEEIGEVIEVIRSGWLTTASRCARLEEDFREFIGCKHALVVNSATAALHLGLEALWVKPGDRVLVPTFTFTATAEVVRYLGIRFSLIVTLI